MAVGGSPVPVSTGAGTKQHRADLLDRLQRPCQVTGEDFVDGVAPIWIGQIDLQNVVPNGGGDRDSVGGQCVSRVLSAAAES
jgi:hypothetical protein